MNRIWLSLFQVKWRILSWRDKEIKMLTCSGRTIGGVSCSNTPAACDNRKPHAITNEHNIIVIVANLNVFEINPSLHMYDKPPSTSPPWCCVNGCLNRLIIPGTIFSNHKICLYWRRWFLQQLPFMLCNPAWKPICIITFFI